MSRPKSSLTPVDLAPRNYGRAFTSCYESAATAVGPEKCVTRTAADIDAKSNNLEVSARPLSRGSSTTNMNHVASYEPLVSHAGTSTKEGSVSPFRARDSFASPSGAKSHLGHGTHPHPTPPVSEIRIPTPQEQDACSSNGDTAPLTNCVDAEDYKNLYFCSQRDIHALQEHVMRIAEENRMLKRQLIQTKKQLFTFSRNKRKPGHGGPVNSAWTIPNFASNCQRSKRTKLAPITEVAEEPTIGQSPTCLHKSVSTDEPGGVSP